MSAIRDLIYDALVDKLGEESATSALYFGYAFIAVSIVILAASSLFKGSSSSGKQPPVYSPGLPIIGSILAFAKDPLQAIKDGRKQCGNVFTMKLFTERVTFLIGPEGHAAFFNSTDEELDQADVYQFMTPIFGNGIVYDVPLNIRRQQLRGLGDTLKPNNLRKYPPIIAKETYDYLTKNWGESGTVELHHAMADLIIMTASATLLGPEIRHQMFHEMHTLYQMLDQGLTPLSVFFPYAPIEAHKKRDQARIEISQLFSRIIKQRRDNPETMGDNIDIVQKLMDFKYKDGRGLTDDEITGMMIAALFAGQHTSSITTSWTILFLLNDAKHGGNYLKKVMEELAVVEKQPGEFAKGEGVDSKVIADEEWLYSCVKEAIRCYPPLILLMRRVCTPMNLPDGTVIPAGDRVMVSNALAQRLPEVFEDPDSYKPERWYDWDITKLPKYSFIGFGGGIHTCMGEPFAFMQVRTILTVLFSMYELELVTPMPTPNYEAIVVGPKGENMIRFKRRGPITPEQIEHQMKIKEEYALAKLNSKPASNGDSANASIGSKEATNVVEGQTVFTKKEIARHNHKDDLWIIVNDKVYDITNYVDIHQGGTDALVRVAGGEATRQVEGPQHPGTVKMLLERYYIGKVATEYSKDEVSKHNKKGDAWIIVNGSVYDVSKFATNDHPGGEDALLRVAGKDATKEFEGPQHPMPNARNVLAKYLIGVAV